MIPTSGEAASEGASDAATSANSCCKADSFHQSPTSPNVGAGLNSLATRCVQINMWREADHLGRLSQLFAVSGLTRSNQRENEENQGESE